MALNTRAKESSKKSKSVSVHSWQQQFALLFDSQAKITMQDRMFFTEQLSLLLETGASLHEALSALKLQSESLAMKRLVDSLMNDIAEGKSFSMALSSHPDVFSSTYINLISASESGGFMHEVLAQLLEMDEKREQLRNTLVSAFSYPLFLIAFSVAVVVFVLVVVFPKFSDMFSQIYDQLPTTTKFLMGTSDLFIQHWMPILMGLLLLIIGFNYWLKSSQGIRMMDQFKLNAPVIKVVFIQLYLVQSLRVMSLSLQHGVSVPDTLRACKDVVSNNIYQEFISRVENMVQQGSGISLAFSNTPFIPPIVEQMIATGEDAGRLPQVMSRIADHYERELSRRLTALSKLAEPMMLLVMGLVVGILVSSLILPIFKLSRAVH